MSILTKASQLSQGQRFPNELLLHVISFLEPTENEILPPSHETTKTLVALMLVCKTANEAASAIFSRHCIHLDCEDRTLRFARCLSIASSHQMSSRSSPFDGIASILLESFTECTAELGEQLALAKTNDSRGTSYSYPDDRTSDWSGQGDRGEEEEEEEDPRESASGSDEDDYYPSPPRLEINDLPVATAVHDILIAVAPTLKRLMINIPLRSLYPENDKLGIKNILLRGFKSLVNLEEFASVQDDGFELTSSGFDILQDHVWVRCWPKLRRLYLYNPYVDGSFWDGVISCPQLDRVMLGRPDSHHPIEPCDFKQSWMAALARYKIETGDYDTTTRALTYVNIDMRGMQPSILRFLHDWRTLDPEGRIRVRLADAPPEAWDGELGDPCPRESVHFWARKHILAGTLWDEDAIGAYDPFAGIEQ